MKIAITYDKGLVFQHFGHTKQFKIYEINDGVISSSQVVDTLGSGHGALAGFLSMMSVDTLICGGIGSGARAALDKAGIKVFGGVQGSADRAAESFAMGGLIYDPTAKCDHHDRQGEEHDCGSHDCGEHSCL